MDEVPLFGSIVSQIIQGDDDNQRIGRKIVVTGIYWQYRLPNLASGGVMDTLILLDKQCNGAAVASSDIFTDTRPGIWNLNRDNDERFEVLGKVADPSVQTIDANGRRHIYCSNLNIPIKFDASTGLVTDLTSNNILIMAGQTLNATPANAPLDLTCRVYYYDA